MKLRDIHAFFGSTFGVIGSSMICFFVLSMFYFIEEENI